MQLSKPAVIYARVSSEGDRQSTDRQVADLEKYITANEMQLIRTFTEKMSGAKEDRPVLSECIDFCVNNHIDTLCVSEISRLGRSVKIVVNTIDVLSKAGVNIFIQNLPMNTLNPDKTPNAMATMITCILGSFAQIERDNIKYRLESGKKLAVARGVQMGRPKGATKSKEKKEQEYARVLRCLRAKKSIRDTAAICDVSVSTVKRLKAEFAI